MSTVVGLVLATALQACPNRSALEGSLSRFAIAHASGTKIATQIEAKTLSSAASDCFRASPIGEMQLAALLLEGQADLEIARAGGDSRLYGVAVAVGDTVVRLSHADETRSAGAILTQQASEEEPVST